MLLVGFVRWWYGPGWRDASNRLMARLDATYLTFSMPILLRTMFAPWKRIISSPGASLGDRARASLDNLISRAVGFTVRLMALIAAVAIMAGIGLIGGLLLMLWPILPLVGPLLIVGGLL